MPYTIRQEMFRSSYISLYESGELESRTIEAENRAHSCNLCPHNCRVNRHDGEEGFCRNGINALVASRGSHHGEEAPLVGTRGSGTIFFANCNMRCVFCQNCDISQSGNGRETSAEELADIMLSLQHRGCHNLNFVTPSHVVPAILRALFSAVPRGFHLPLVYNSGGYDSLSTLGLLDGIFDIYMPDLKYADNATAKRLSEAPGYPEIAARAVTEMHRQVGDLSISGGIATRGLLVRHLVLPQDLAGSRSVIDFVSRLSKDTYLNLMDQYHPAYLARRYPGLGRRITLEEYDEVLRYARSTGLFRLDGYTKV